MQGYKNKNKWNVVSNADICVIYGKLFKLHINVLLFSNNEKVLKSVSKFMHPGP